MWGVETVNINENHERFMELRTEMAQLGVQQSLARFDTSKDRPVLARWETKGHVVVGKMAAPSKPDEYLTYVSLNDVNMPILDGQKVTSGAVPVITKATGRDDCGGVAFAVDSPALGGRVAANRAVDQRHRTVVVDLADAASGAGG